MSKQSEVGIARPTIHLIPEFYRAMTDAASNPEQRHVKVDTTATVRRETSRDLSIYKTETVELSYLAVTQQLRRNVLDCLT